MSGIIEDFNNEKISSAYIKDFFSTGKTKLEQQGYRIISLEENAALRILEGYESDVSRSGNIVREGVVIMPGILGGFLTKTPSFINNNPAPIRSTSTRNYLTDEEFNQSLVNSIKFSGKPIPADRFDEDPLTNFIFGRFSGDYGRFLKERGIDELILPIQANTKSIRRPFIEYIFFEGINYHTGIDEWRGGKENLEGGERSSLIGLPDSPSIANPKLSPKLRGIKKLK
jgi:hypothetical protein